MPCICLYAKQSKCIDKMNNDESRDKRTREKRVVKCFIREQVIIVLHVHLQGAPMGVSGCMYPARKLGHFRIPQLVFGPIPHPE